MTPVQIAYFKHFLYDSGLNKMYVYRYRHHRIKGGPEGDSEGNPESIEQFFMKQPFFRVMMKAFYFEMNSQYGHDFWKEQDKKWHKYWELHEDNINNPNYVNLKGSFSILRQNWDKPQFWKSENLESPEEVYKRMGIEPPIPLDSASTLCKFKTGDIIQSHISDEVQTITAITAEGYELEDGGIVEFDKEKYWMKIDEKADEPQEESEREEEEVVTTDDLPDIDDFSGVPEYDDGLEFFDVGAGSRSRTNRLKKGQASLNFRSHSFKVTFNQEDSKKLKQNNYKFVRLAKNKQGDIVIQMHKLEGISNCPVSLTFNSSNGNNNATINSKDLCEKLKTLLNLSGDYFLLKVEELYMDFDKANYKISK